MCRPAASDLPSTAPDATRAAVDELLFEPTAWFVIDALNARVRGVAPGSLPGALAVCGRGRVATVVGQLRPEVVAVDVDATGALGDLAVEHIRDWCRARRLWHLVRPSGGGPGRAHVLIVPGVHQAALTEHVPAVRDELGLRSTTAVAVMRTLRPLCAPHRRTGLLSDVGDLTKALADLQQVLDPVPQRIAARRAARRTTVATTGQGEAVQRRPQHTPVPLVPLSRPRRPLPPQWTTYLEQGQPAVAEHGLDDGEPGTTSLVELRCTRQLVITGHTAAQAWAAVHGAHPTAFTKARGRGQHWWHTAAWNPAVTSADAWLAAQRANRPGTTSGGRQLTAHAWDVLWADWTTWDARTRHTDREILSVLLTRMDRVRSTSIPIPQRDLLQDCAIASRTTVRAALDRLRAAGYLTRSETYMPGTTDTAHTWSLGPRLTSPIPGGVSVIGPSRGTPPLRRPAPLALRRGLGLATAHLLTHLPPAGHPTPLTLDQLATTLGFLTPDQDVPLTSRQTRTLTDRLRTLDRAGLARVDEHGRWRATPVADTLHHADIPAPTAAAARLQRAGDQLHQDVVQAVHTERARFRAALDPATRAARWRQQQAAALARQVKADVARHRAWWTGLPATVRAQRAAAAADAFAALSPTQQDQRRRELVARRAQAGTSERDRHAAWLAGLSPTDLEHRSITRALTYRARPDVEQHQLADAWARQRTDWHLPHPTRARHAPPPDPTTGSDTTTPPPAAPIDLDALLDRPDPTTTELVLLDLKQHQQPSTAHSTAYVTAS